MEEEPSFNLNQLDYDDPTSSQCDAPPLSPPTQRQRYATELPHNAESSGSRSQTHLDYAALMTESLFYTPPSRV